MRFAVLLASALALAASQVNALTININSASCTAIDWSIRLDSREEYVQASTLRFYAASSDSDFDSLHSDYTVSANGDVKSYGVWYTFTTYVDDSDRPAGISWQMGAGLIDYQNNFLLAADGTRLIVYGTRTVTGCDATPTPVPAPVSTSPASTTIPGSSGTDTPSPKPLPVKQETHGVPTGAVAGGIVGAVLLLLGAMIWLIVRRRKLKQEAQASGANHVVGGGGGNTAGGHQAAGGAYVPAAMGGAEAVGTPDLEKMESASGHSAHVPTLASNGGWATDNRRPPSQYTASTAGRTNNNNNNNNSAFFTSPPTSPLMAAHNRPMSQQSLAARPMSPANNPLFGNAPAPNAVANNAWHPEPMAANSAHGNQLAEPMTRY